MSLLFIHCRHLITGGCSSAIGWLLPFGSKEFVPSTWTSSSHIRKELAKLCASSLLIQTPIRERFLKSSFKAVNSPIADKQSMESSKCSLVSAASNKWSVHSPLLACTPALASMWFYKLQYEVWVMFTCSVDRGQIQHEVWVIAFPVDHIHYLKATIHEDSSIELNCLQGELVGFPIGAQLST